MRRYIYIIIFLFLFDLSTASGKDSAMVATANPIVSQIGSEILKEGGNAVDAAVAVMFALSVVEPWASGLGGGGFMLIKMQNSAQPVVIDFRERAPIGADPQLFYRDSETFRYYAYTGFRSICVPGTVAGADLALSRFGTKKINEVLEPVIQLARKGFTVSDRFNKIITTYYDLIEMNRATSIIYLPDWLPLRIGDLVTREDFAVTLETLSLKGLQSFYKGEMASELTAEIERNNGLLVATDFYIYQPIIRNPVVGNYRGYQIMVPPPPSSGGVTLIQLLNILEKFNLKQLGYNSGDYIHVFTEALKLVLQDREKYSGDPDFARISIDGYLSKPYASTISTKIDSQQARFVTFDNSALKYESDNASHVSIIDRDNNIVSLTQTLDFYFGSGITHPKYGILFNNGLFHFSQDSVNINAIAPKKRSASSMAPTIILKDGVPVLILGSSGASRTISALAHIIISIVDFGMDIQSAIESPRFFYEKGKIELETRILSDSIERLKKLGHQVNLKTDYNTYFGIAQGIQIDAKTGKLHGACDPRGEGEAVGY